MHATGSARAADGGDSPGSRHAAPPWRAGLHARARRGPGDRDSGDGWTRVSWGDHAGTAPEIRAIARALRCRIRAVVSGSGSRLELNMSKVPPSTMPSLRGKM